MVVTRRWKRRPAAICPPQTKCGRDRGGLTQPCGGNASATRRAGPSTESRLQSAPRPSSAARCPATGGAAPRCTTRQRNTHISETRDLLYRWHPWFGKQVAIVAALERRERSVYRCIREEAEAKPPLEVPKWMFDETVCSRTRAATAGVVSLEDLQQLRLLLREAVSVPKADGVQGQQGSSSRKELLMRKEHRRCRSQQLELFRPRVQRPGWETLPKEVREKAIQELAQLLKHASV